MDDSELNDALNGTKLQMNKINEQAEVNTKVAKEKASRTKNGLQEYMVDTHSNNKSFDKHQMLSFLKKEDFEAKYLAELKDYFTDDLKGFTAPNVRLKSNNSVSNLKHILRTIGNYQVAIVYGEGGWGKTSLTK